MSNNLEPLLEAAERRAVLTVLRAHPEWTLAQVLSQLEHNGRRAPLLRALTLGELFTEPGVPAGLAGYEPIIDQVRLQAARKLTYQDFDEVVRVVIGDAGGKAVAASYLTARVGGPRWKLQASLRRLVNTGAIERTGTTSGTRYRAAARRAA